MKTDVKICRCADVRMKSILPVLLFIFLISHFTFSCIAQESKVYFEPSVNYGRIIRHTTPFPEINHNTITLEFNITQQPSGKKLWHRLYPVSSFGIGLVFSDYGEKDTLGYGIGILPNITFGREKSRKINFYYTLGTGPAYLTRPYNIFDNENNNVIGSHFNVIVYLNFGISWRLSENLLLKPSFSFIHYSNGRAKLPNLGYNIPSVSLIAKIFLDENKRETRTDSTPPLNKQFHFGIQAGYGFNQLRVSRGPIYPIYFGKIFGAKNISLKNQLSAGIEYFFDKGIYSFLQLNEIDVGQQQWKASRLVLFAGHEYLIGHLGFYVQGGVFLNKPTNTGTKFPTKLGIQYYFYTPYFRNHHHLFTGIYLAAHSFEADYVGVAIGYVY